MTMPNKKYKRLGHNRSENRMVYGNAGWSGSTLFLFSIEGGLFQREWTTVEAPEKRKCYSSILDLFPLLLHPVLTPIIDISSSVLLFFVLELRRSMQKGLSDSRRGNVSDMRHVLTTVF